METLLEKPSKIKYLSNNKLSFSMGPFSTDRRCEKARIARLFSFFTPRSEKKFPRSKMQSNIARIFKL